jgi:uncharacterized protein YndB with AHSA1/START domain
MNQAVIAPVRYELTVPVSADQAFRLFTAGFNSWWIGHHIGKADLQEVVLESKAGGRWYERGVDGTECEWGTVLVFEPPRRLVVTWQLNAEFEYDPDPEHASEVEVLFIEQDGQTKVEFQHRYIERLGAGAEDLAKAVGKPDGWPGILDRFGAAAAKLAAA